MKLLYKPFGLLFGALGGAAASALFSWVWSLIAGRDAPEARDPDRSWREILAATAIEGAIFGGVKALIDRAGAKSFARATGTWPA